MKGPPNRPLSLWLVSALLLLLGASGTVDLVLGLFGSTPQLQPFLLLSLMGVCAGLGLFSRNPWQHRYAVLVVVLQLVCLPLILVFFAGPGRTSHITLGTWFSIALPVRYGYALIGAKWGLLVWALGVLLRPDVRALYRAP